VLYVSGALTCADTSAAASAGSSSASISKRVRFMSFTSDFSVPRGRAKVIIDLQSSCKQVVNHGVSGNIPLHLRTFLFFCAPNHRNRRAFPDLALDFQLPTVRFRNHPAQAEPQPRAT
jgi:hypothetical protein